MLPVSVKIELHTSNCYTDSLSPCDTSKGYLYCDTVNNADEDDTVILHILQWNT